MEKEIEKYGLAHYYFNVDLLIDYLKKFCINNDIDYNEVTFLDGGESSIVFKYRDYVIKMSSTYYYDLNNDILPINEYVKNSDAIVQPIKCDNLLIDDKYLSISLFPFLDNKDITVDEMMDVYYRLRDDGFLWGDIKRDNIGRDKNGKCYLIDYGELLNYRYMNLYSIKYNLNLHKKSKKKYDLMYQFRNKDYKKSFMINDKNISLFEVLSILNDIYFYSEFMSDCENGWYDFDTVTRLEYALAIYEFLIDYFHNYNDIKLDYELIFRGFSVVGKFDTLKKEKLEKLYIQLHGGDDYIESMDRFKKDMNYYYDNYIGFRGYGDEVIGKLKL